MPGQDLRARFEEEFAIYEQLFSIDFDGAGVAPADESSCLHWAVQRVGRNGDVRKHPFRRKRDRELPRDKECPERREGQRQQESASPVAGHAARMAQQPAASPKPQKRDTAEPYRHETFQPVDDRHDEQQTWQVTHALASPLLGPVGGAPAENQFSEKCHHRNQTNDDQLCAFLKEQDNRGQYSRLGRHGHGPARDQRGQPYSASLSPARYSA